MTSIQTNVCVAMRMLSKGGRCGTQAIGPKTRLGGPAFALVLASFLPAIDGAVKIGEVGCANDAAALQREELLLLVVFEFHETGHLRDHGGQPDIDLAMGRETDEIGDPTGIIRQ